MKIFRYLVFMVVCLGFLSSCIKKVYFELPENERKIVVSSLISPDSLVVVHLSKSNTIGALGWKPLTEIASVTLYENDQQKGDLSVIEGSYYSLQGFIPKPGNTYTLEIAIGDLNPVTCNTVIPEKIDIGRVDTLSRVSESGSGYLTGSVSVRDPADEQNYYAVVVWVTHREWDYNTRQFLDHYITYPAEIILTGAGQVTESIDFIGVGSPLTMDSKHFFNDAMINGKEFHVDFEVPTRRFHEVDTVFLDVELDHVAKSYYQYAVSYVNYLDSNVNPFSEPVQVYTNVENGLGLFSAYVASHKKIVVVRGGPRFRGDDMGTGR